MNKQRRTSNINNIVRYDTSGNVSLPAGLTVEGLDAGFVKSDANGLFSVDTAAYVTLSSLLTGYVVGSNADIAATDTILQAFGKLQGQIDNIPSVNMYNSNGTLTGIRTIDTGGFDLIYTGTDTAIAGYARFIQMTPTLIASANGDNLIGLDVNPTFTPGGLTSVKRWGTRTRSLWINHENWNAVNATAALYIGDADSAAFYVQPGVSTGTGTTELFMRGNNPALGSWYFTLQADYNVTFNTGGYVENMFFKMGNSNIMILRQSGSVLLGTDTEIASSILTLSSTAKGFLQPRMTTVQRDAIGSPATGLSIYNTTTNTIDFYNGTSWLSGGINIYNSDGTLTGNRTINAGGFSLTLNPNTNLAGSLFGNTVRTRDSFSGSYTQNGTVFSNFSQAFDGLSFTGNTLYMGQSNIEVTGGSTTVQTQGIDIEQHIKLSGGTSRISASNYILQYRGYSGDISTNSGNVMLGISISTGHNKSDTTTSIVTGGVTGNAANIFNYVGTINNAYGYSSTLNATTSASHKSSTIANYISFRSTAVIGATSGTSTATITNYYGIYLDTPVVRLTGSIGSRWGIYAPDVLMNHHINGSLLLGTATPSIHKLDVIGSVKISAQLILSGYTSTSSYTGTAAGFLAFDLSGNIITVAAPSGGGGTVTSVSGTGTVSGLTLSGTVTTSGSLTLGGSLTLTSGNITTGLGYTPYNATNPSGYVNYNIYTSDGILSGDRYINANNNSFRIDNVNTFHVSIGGTLTNNEVALFESAQPHINIKAAGATNPASLFLSPSTGYNGGVHNRTGGGLEFYVGSPVALAMTIGANKNVGIGGSPNDINSLEVSTANKWSGAFIGNMGGERIPSVNYGIHLGWNYSTSGESNILWGTGDGPFPYLTFSSWNGTSKVDRMVLSDTGKLTLKQYLTTSSFTGTPVGYIAFDSTGGLITVVAPTGGTPAGSTGQIQFNSSGAFGADSNLIWDDANNRLGVGVATPSTSIHTAGSVTATGFFESSDARLKSDILDYSSNELALVQAKIYTKNGRTEIGYLAQDVEPICNSAVMSDVNGYKHLSYREVHTAKIAALEKEIKELKNIINGLV